MKTTAGSAARAGGASIPPHTKNDPAATHAAAICIKARRRSSAPRSLRTVVMPCWSLGSSSSVERTAPPPLTVRDPKTHSATENELPCNQSVPFKAFDLNRGRFDHGTGVDVKALGGRSGELEEQRAPSVAKKKAGRLAARLQFAFRVGVLALLFDSGELAHLVSGYAQLNFVAVPG